MTFRCALVASFVAVLLIYADGTGVTPRASGLQYEAHGEADGATIGASIVPQKEAAKLFTSDVLKRHVVIEVAVYPKAGHEVEIQWFDFALLTKSGGKSHPATPDEVSAVWRGHRAAFAPRPPTPGKPYEIFGPSRYESGPDWQALEAKLQLLALPKGRTNRDVAGYLYFPVPIGAKHDVASLEYSSSASGAVSLIFGTKMLSARP